jgi:hypothetical protein
MNRSSALDRTSPPVPAATHIILGGGGVKLHAREWGNLGGPPLLFIHGWPQSDLCCVGKASQSRDRRLPQRLSAVSAAPR